MSGKDIFNISGKIALITDRSYGSDRKHFEAMAGNCAVLFCSDMRMKQAQKTIELIFILSVAG